MFQIKKIGKKMWDSTILTTMTSLIVSLLRFMALTPIILIKFNNMEVSFFYLIASFLIFSDILKIKMCSVFITMLSFAKSGREDLAPLSGKKEVSEEMNEKSFTNCLYVGKKLLARVAIFFSLVSAGLAAYGLGNLIQWDFSSAENRDLMYVIPMVGLTDYIGFMFCNKAIGLYGIGKIALVNRLAIVADIMIIILGVIVVYHGYGLLSLLIIQTTCKLAIIPLLNSYCIALLPQTNNRPSLKEQKEIVGWAWTPFWKGIVGNVSDMGTKHITLVVLTAYLSPIVLAPYLMLLNMYRVGILFAQAPLVSDLTNISSRLAKSDNLWLRDFFFKRITLMVVLFSMGVVVLVIFGQEALNYIGSSMILMDQSIMILLGGAVLLDAIFTNTCTIVLSTNRDPFYLQLATSAIIAIVALYTVVDRQDLLLIIIVVYLPKFICLNLKPFKEIRKYIS